MKKSSMQAGSASAPYEISPRRRLRMTLFKLASCAMLIALFVVLDNLGTVLVGNGIQIGFGAAPPMLAGMLFGPFGGAAVYGIGDLVSALLLPKGTFHPGFTLSSALMGFIWGFFLHPHPFKKFRNWALDFDTPISRFLTAMCILIPTLVNCLVIGLFVNTLWVSQLYGSRTYLGWFLYRLSQYAVMIPVNILLTSALLPVATLLRKQFFKKI